LYNFDSVYLTYSAVMLNQQDTPWAMRRP